MRECTERKDEEKIKKAAEQWNQKWYPNQWQKGKGNGKMNEMEWGRSPEMQWGGESEGAEGEPEGEEGEAEKVKKG